MTIVYDTPNTKFLEEIMSVGRPNKGTHITSLELNEDVRVDEANKESIFKAGDTVIAKDHKSRYAIAPDHYDANKPGMHNYGQVYRTTSMHAHAKWADGTETKHRLHDGSHVGGEMGRDATPIVGSADDHHTAHAAAHPASVEKNLARKAEYEKKEEEYQIKSASDNRKRHISGRLQSNEHHLSPEHAAAIHKILDEANFVRGHHGNELRDFHENPRYGVNPEDSPEHLHHPWMKDMIAQRNSEK